MQIIYEFKQFLRKSYKVLLILVLLVGIGVVVLISQFQTQNQVYKKSKGVKASEILNTYYVSLAGNDSNTGTQALPFKSFAKAISLLKPGETLLIMGGTYTEKIRVPSTVKGQEGLPITIKSAPGQKVSIDLMNNNEKFIDISGSYIIIEGIEGYNSNGVCVNLVGTHITVSQIVAHDCKEHGIYTEGQYNAILNSTVYLSCLSNQNRIISSGWGSGIKVRVGGDNILIEGNTVYHNYGEGIAATRGTNVTIRNNRVYDNYSVNIYVDNSHDVVVEKNFVTCSLNSGFERGNLPPTGMLLSEEFYDGWGSQLARVKVSNNIVAYCNKGISFHVAGNNSVDQGLDSVAILNNTFWGSVETALSIEYDSPKTRNSIIANNIIQQPNGKLSLIANSDGITLHHNFWVTPGTPSSNAVGFGDKMGDVKMAVSPGYTPESFALSSASTALDTGATNEITDDYFGTTRPQKSGIDMGAVEFTESTVPVPTSTPFIPSITVTPRPPTSTPTYLPTPIPTSSIQSLIKRESVNQGSVKVDKTLSVSTNTQVPAGQNRLYIATISTKTNVSVWSVSGLGLVWSKIGSQCGGRSITRTEMWWAYGSPTKDEVVKAQFVNPAYLQTAVIGVVGYSGTARSPLKNIITKNSLGIGDTVCKGGVDSKNYSSTFVNSSSKSLFVGVVGIREYKHTPAADIIEVLEIHTNRGGGSDSGIAVLEKSMSGIGMQTVAGTQSSKDDYSYIGAEILPL